MSILRELLIIFSIVLTGDFVATLLPIPIPGNIIGMLLLLGLLLKKYLTVNHIKHTTDFLLKNMAFFFVPAGIGVIKNRALLEGKVVQVVLICVVSTIITFGVTGKCAQMIIQYEQKKKGKHNERSI